MAFDPATLGPGVIGALVAFFLAFLLFFLLLLIAIYVYASLAMMAVAKRLKMKNPWLAWVPIGNVVLLADMAGMHWWPVLLLIGFLIPFVNIACIVAFMVFTYIWTWKVCERLNRPGWWSLLQLIPLFGFIWGLVLWGILAWGKE